jgi:hypothetical protein
VNYSVTYKYIQDLHLRFDRVSIVHLPVVLAAVRKNIMPISEQDEQFV